jgi:AcrR family transcriptional regulator
MHIVNSRTPRSSSRSHSRSRRPAYATAEPERLTREERKRQTRQAIVDAALGLLADGGFSGLSLREVTREAGIAPAAFYRHFESMEALGLALIVESFRTLREALRRAREELDPEHIIVSSAAALTTSITEHRRHWRFVTRARAGGVSVLRYAIRAEIRLITSELATDLARLEGMSQWTTEDLNVLASLFVGSMVSVAEALEDAEDPAAREEIQRLAAKQLRMIAVGVVGWRSS